MSILQTLKVRKEGKKEEALINAIAKAPEAVTAGTNQMPTTCEKIKHLLRIMFAPLIRHKSLKFRQDVPFSNNPIKLLNLFERNRFGPSNLGCNDRSEHVTEMAGLLHS